MNEKKKSVYRLTQGGLLLEGRLLLSDGEKATLAEIAKRVGRKALTEIARGAKPETILA